MARVQIFNTLEDVLEALDQIPPPEEGVPISTLIDAHLLTQDRVRGIVRASVQQLWRGMPSYNEEDIDFFTDLISPVIYSGQRQAMALTEAFVARQARRAAKTIVIGAVGGLTAGGAVGTYQAIRGVALKEAYRRPFVATWAALADGREWAEAVNIGEARAVESAAMDIQMANRSAYSAIQKANPQIRGYQRTVNAGGCSFCAMLDGAVVHSADAMALHNNCGCGLDPLFQDAPVTPAPDGVAIHEHGELGPVLADPAHDFTGPSDI